MLQLIGNARNIYLMPQPEPARLDATCELILLTEERVYEITGEDKMVATHKIKDVRIFASAKSLHGLALNIMKMVNEMEVLEASARLAPVDESITDVSIPEPV
jgi:hypothetical protein